MAEVPYVPVPQVANTSAAGTMQSVPNANAEAFGAGVGLAMQHLGATVQQSAAQVGDEVLKFQNLQNETEANNLLMDAAQALGEEKIKLQSMEGQAAVDYLPTYNANVQKIRQDFLSKSNNPMVQHMLDLQLTRTSKYALIDGAGRAGTEAKKALAASRAGTIGQAAADAANADELSFKSSLDKVNETVNAELAERHVDLNSDEAKQYRSQQIGQLWQNRLVMKSMTDPYAAKQMLDKVPKDQITPDITLAVTKVIESNAINVGARNIASATNPVGVAGNAPVAVKYQHGVNFFVKEGYSREQAIGIMNNLTHESGGVLNPAATNPGDGADGSDAIGIGQWNGTRAIELQKFARAQGKDWKDFDTQLAFVAKELNTSESRAKAALLKAGDRNAATVAFMTGYERPGSPQLANRIAMGKKYADLQNVPDPTSPQKMTADQVQKWEDAARQRAEEQFPGDPRVADAAVMRVRQQVSQSDQVAVRYQREQFNALSTALTGGADGKGALPTNRDQLFNGDPNMVRAFNSLDANQQRAIDRTLEKNAKGETIRWTPENRTRFNELKGMAANDPDAFHNVFIPDEQLPQQAKMQLLDMQQNPPKEGDVGMAKALSVLKSSGMLEAAGIDPAVDKEGFHHFYGALQASLENWHAQNPRHTGAVPDDVVLKMMPELVKDVPKTQQSWANRMATRWFGAEPATVKAYEERPAAAAASAAGVAKTLEQQLIGSGIPGITIPGLRAAFVKRYGRTPQAEDIKNLYWSSPAVMRAYPPAKVAPSIGEAKQ